MLFISSYLCLDFLALKKRRLNQKDKVNFKIYDVTIWLTNSCITHILSNISPNKDNQTMKFGQIIEYNKENIF